MSEYPGNAPDPSQPTPEQSSAPAPIDPPTPTEPVGEPTMPITGPAAGSAQEEPGYWERLAREQQAQQPQSPYAQNPYGQQPGHTQPYPTQPAYGQPAYPPQSAYPPPYAQVAPMHGSATTALVLGLVSLVGGFVCGLPILAAPFAWFIGRKALREIQASQGRLRGQGEAKAGMILGIIGTVLLILGILAFIAIVVIAVATDSSSV